MSCLSSGFYRINVLAEDWNLNTLRNWLDVGELHSNGYCHYFFPGNFFGYLGQVYAPLPRCFKVGLEVHNEKRLFLVQNNLSPAKALPFNYTRLLYQVFVLGDEVFVAKIRRDPLGDACGLDIKNGCSSRTCLPASFLGYESYRVRFELQPVFPLWGIDQLGICKKPSVQQDLVVVPYERPTVTHLKPPFLKRFNEVSQLRCPFLFEAPYSIDRAFSRKPMRFSARQKPLRA